MTTLNNKAREVISPNRGLRDLKTFKQELKMTRSSGKN
jgi:hypothetical protein